MKPPVIVKCPTCQAPVAWVIEHPERPFCSQRCRLIDLGAWANEHYSVPITEPVEPDHD